MTINPADGRNFASVAISNVGGGTLTQTGPDAYLLNLGTTGIGGSIYGAVLSIKNDAAAPADFLDGTYQIAGDTTAFATSVPSFSLVVDPGDENGSEALDAVGQVSLLTTQAGSFTETITLDPSDDDGAGAILPLTPIAITVEGSVLPTPNAVTISGIPAAEATSDSADIAPFVNVGVTDVGGSATYSLWVVEQTPGNGDLMDPGTGGSVSSDGATFSMTDVTAAQIQSALQSLLFQPVAQEVAPGQSVATGLSVLIQGNSGDTLLASAQTTVTATAAADAFALELPPPPSVPFATAAPLFAGVTLIDANPGAEDTATIVLTVNGVASDANGTLSGTGLTKTGTGTYVLAAATPTVEQADLQGLVFAPVSLLGGTTTGVAIQIADGVAAPIAVQTTFTLAANPGGTVVVTNATSSSTTYDNIPVSQTVQAYSTTITASIGGTAIYSQTFALPFSDPTVQAAVAQADAAVAADHATAGPTVLSASATTSSATTATTTGLPTIAGTPSTSSTVTFGPNFIDGSNVNALVGSGNAFPVLAGQEDINVNTAIQYLVTQSVTTTTTNLLTQTYTIAGTQYSLAAGTVTPVSEIVHVGSPGTVALAVANTAAADGFSESLIATLLAASGGIGIDSAGPSPDIAAGETNTTALAISFSTAEAGTISGTGTIGLTSDGGTGPDSIDGLGQTTLPDQTVPVSIVVDNYANAELTSDGNLTASGANAYTLNLGTVTEGSAALSADLIVSNDTAGPADWLNGSYAVSGSSQFGNAGFAAFGTIGAGGSVDAGGVTLATNQLGVFSESIVLTPTDSNADGFSEVMAAQTVTVTGTVVPTGVAQGDVHVVTYDGLHYDFQADGSFVLTRSTVPGDSFQIQIQTAPDPADDAVSYTTEAAAQVGSDVVTFAIERDTTVWVDGVPDTALTAADPVQTLDGGVLSELAPGSFQLTWASGEVLCITDQGSHLDSSVALGAANGPGSVQGLLGADSGQADDFQLPDGSVLAQPLSGAELYGAFASAWSVTPANSLLGNAPACIGTDPAIAPAGIGTVAGDTTQFIYADGAGGQSVLQATAPGQVLSVAPGVGVLSDAGGFGVTFLGTLAQLAASLIAGFSAKDLIDIIGLNSAAVTTSYAGSGSAGVLYLTDGTQSGELYLTGQIGEENWHVSSDGHGGTQIGMT